MDNNLLPDNAATLIANFQANQLEGQLKSVFFREGSLRKILDLPGCQGIRFHIGSESGKLCIIAEPADRNGHPVSIPTSSPTEATLLAAETVSSVVFFSPDFSCPNDCPPDN